MALTGPTDKLYYTIGEVAQMLAVSTSMIRFWESEFTHIKPKKTSKGDRRYTSKEIDELRLIYTLVKERGYTLQGAKEYLKGGKPKRQAEAIETLERVKAFLLEMKTRLPS